MRVGQGWHYTTESHLLVVLWNVDEGEQHEVLV